MPYQFAHKETAHHSRILRPLSEPSRPVELSATHDTGHPDTLCNILDAQFSLCPEQIAVEVDKTILSYALLESASTRLASILRRRGVKPGDYVPILAPRCLEVAVAFVAVLQVGASYVPMDAGSWSQHRILATIDLVDAETVIFLNDTVELRGHNVVTLEEVKQCYRGTTSSGETVNGRWNGEDIINITPDMTAYMIFTSGSTGAPKGVMIPHRALANYVQETPFNLDTTSSDRVFIPFSTAFDAFTGALFSTLCNGATAVIGTVDQFSGIAKTCTVLTVTPSMLQALHPSPEYSKIRAIFLGGEKPPGRLVEQWATPSRILYNCYGPTETTCTSLISKLTPGEPIVLGDTMRESRVILLEPASMQEADDEGEICISGPGLATGYFRNENLTRTKFINVLLNSTCSELFYRTGDTAKRTKQGLQFLGRNDSVVKNRGFLINLEADVKPALLSCPGVQDAAALMYRDKLIGFVIPCSLSGEQIRNFLADTVDTFLVPERIYTLEKFPLTPNDKVDLRALVAWVEKEASSLIAKKNGRSTMSLPQEVTSETLISTIASVLDILPSQVDLSSSFWKLGGNSLLGIRLKGELGRLGIVVPSVRSLYQEPLIKLADLTVDGHVDKNDKDVSFIEGSSPSLPRISIPITTMQQKMLQGTMANPALNHLLIKIHIRHKNRHFDLEKLRRAFLYIFGRHTIFRTRFDPQLQYQTVEEETTLDFKQDVCEANRLDETTSQWERALLSDMYNGTHIGRGNIQPFKSLRVISVHCRVTNILWCVHHSLVDGWSTQIILSELQAFMDDRIQHYSAVDFGHVAHVLHDATSVVDNEQVKSWNKFLSGFMPPKSLYIPRITNKEESSEFWPEETSTMMSAKASLRSLASQLNHSEASILYGAWAILLSRYLSTDKVIFGVVLSGRDLDFSSADQVVGPMMNLSPLAIQVKEEDRLETFLRSTQESLLNIQEFQWSASKYLAENVSPALQLEMFTSILAVQLGLHSQSEKGTGAFCWSWTQRAKSEFPLTMVIEDGKNDSLIIRAVYDDQKFAKPYIKRLVAHYHNIVKEILGDGTKSTIGSVLSRMMNTEEYRLLTRPHDKFYTSFEGAENLSIAIANATQQWPGATALQCGARSLTYQELQDVSTRAAAGLQGFLHGDDKSQKVVSVISDGSIEWVICILAILKAGAAYCPIDIQLPQERMKTVVSESKSSAVVCPNGIAQSACHGLFSIPVLLLEDMGEDCIDEPPANPTACIIFTSGSTGVPKAIALPHVGILSYISFPPARLEAAPGRRIAQSLSVGFDTCVAEIFGSLCYGATLLLRQDDVFSHLKEVHATMATPSILSALDPKDFENLELIVTGGEAIPQALLDRWASGRRMFNSYGPSECTIGSTFSSLSSGNQITLGRSIPRMNVYILDEQLRPVPVGVPGEICLTGIQVTSGYLNRTTETYERFIKNPFAKESRMYRTGDRGCWTEDGDVEYVGRTDNLVKVRGFRVDLSEVETAISRLSSSELNSVCVVISNGNLIGFVEPSSVNTSQMIDRLSQGLPPHAVPSAVIAMERLPRTMNQKIDRRELGKIDWKQRFNGQILELETDTEHSVSRVWKNVLNLDTYDGIGASSDFMALGGHSLLRIKVARDLSKQFGHSIPLSLIVKNPSVRDLSKAIDEHIVSMRDSLQPTNRSNVPFLRSPRLPRSKTILPLSHLEEEMYLQYLMTEHKSALNIACVFNYPDSVSVERLRTAVDATIESCEVLRSRYSMMNGVPQRTLYDSFTTTNLATIDSSSIQDRLVDVISSTPFDLGKEHPFRSLIISNETNNGGLLVLVCPHIVADKTTVTLLVRMINSHYHEDEIVNIANCDHHKKNWQGTTQTLDYIDWARWSKTKESQPEAATFWISYLRQRPSSPFIPRKNRILTIGPGNTCTKTVPELAVKGLRHLSSDASTSRLQVVLGAVYLSICALLGSSDVVLGIPFADRSEPGTEELVGLFLDRIPIRFQMSEREFSSTDIFMSCIRQSIESAVTHYIPYQAIQHALLTQEQDVVGGTLFDIMVTYHSREDPMNRQDFLGAPLDLIPFRVKGVSKFPLLFEFNEIADGSVTLDVEYRAELFTNDDVCRLQLALFQVLSSLDEMEPLMILSSIKHQFSNQAMSSIDATHSTNIDGEFEGTRTDITRQAFADTLGLEPEKIRDEDSFFRLGGCSVDLTRVQYFLSRRGYYATLEDLILLESPIKISENLRLVDR